MLVYEYISNGTLYHYIHHRISEAPIPTDEWLRIVVESSNALANMHSSASPPIIHGDVKSANILLDDNLIAKVSDFGASKLVPYNEVEITTKVHGTLGYLDPEYLISYQLTDKSDVYSFAVVILELLTRKKAHYFEGSEEDRSLVLCFQTAKEEGRFQEILDAQVRNELKLEVIEEIEDLIMQCLRKNREERPTMREVAERLEMVRRLQRHTVAEEQCAEETESLIGGSVGLYLPQSDKFYTPQATFEIEKENNHFNIIV